ncbi:MAG TPA: hypothetical protein VL225_17610 [Vicinamibacterales bacterium]|jgi:hypothetical protein|nr:hypothetical protein [Vicinamibacterales bacterium]
MQRVLVIAAAVVLVLHGLIHLMGTAAYLKLANVTGIPYKTTLLNRRWDVGDTGIRVFGVLWTVAAFGFIVAAVALLAGSTWWRSVLLAITGLSLVLTALDWNVAFAGVFVNVAILAVLFFAR